MFAVKFDGMKRAKCMARGYVMPIINVENSTSIVVSLDTMNNIVSVDAQPIRLLQHCRT